MLGATRRIQSALLADFETAIEAVLGEIRDLTGFEAVMLTLLSDRAGVPTQRAAMISIDPSSTLPLDTVQEWDWADGLCARMLAAGLTYTPGFTDAFPGHPVAMQLSVRGYLSLPVRADADGRVVATLCAMNSRDVAVSEDALSFSTFLAAAASALVTRELARREAAVAAERIDAALLGTLQSVREAQDQVGNSIAVVLGWLRLLGSGDADGTGAPGGIQIATRRLEEAQTSIAELLRRTAATALHDYATDRVNASAVLRDLGDPFANANADPDPDPDPDPRDVWVLANRTYLSAFLALAAHGLGGRPLVAGDAWLVPFVDAGLLTTSSLLTLNASGGSIVGHAAGQAARWPLAPPAVT